MAGAPQQSGHSSPTSPGASGKGAIADSCPLRRLPHRPQSTQEYCERGSLRHRQCKLASLNATSDLVSHSGFRMAFDVEFRCLWAVDGFSVFYSRRVYG
ncbi:hypothetical protein VUR80DRAFT_2990 [Thermomyces stellatus]